MLQAKGIGVSYQGYVALQEIDLCLSSGQWLMVIGPNGAGKSSLLRALAQVQSHQGQVFLNGQAAGRMPAKAFAREVAMLAQNRVLQQAFTVEQLVGLGRYAWQGPLGGADPDGQRHIEEAMERCGLIGKRRQNAFSLSGGELQRAFLAQVFAQDPKILLLDEPASHLDLPFQKAIFDLVKDWLKGPGRAVLSVVHDLLLARAYGSHAILLSGGRQVIQAEMETVMQGQILERAYGMDVPSWLGQLYRPWHDGQNDTSGL